MKKILYSRLMSVMLAQASVLIFASLVAAQGFLLSNGAGDGSLTVGVDGFGSFGSTVGEETSNAFYDPLGPLESAGTVYQSALFISGPAAWLSSGNISDEEPFFDPDFPDEEPVFEPTFPALPNPTITDNGGRASSSFTIGSAQFDLTQSLIDSFDDDGARVGTILDQRYTIRNLAEVPNSFTLTRYVDGDLSFDNSISDGGGLLSRAGNQILYETDASSGSSASTTFVGITASGNFLAGGNGRYQVDSFSDLREQIQSGAPLNNTIAGDLDGDNFIDEAYDVTLGLSTFIELGASGVVSYVTQTLFGNAVPPTPGSSEALPLLPNNDEPPFVFEVDVDANETIWFDPEVTVGFEYEVLGGPAIGSFTLPSLGPLADFGEYQLELLLDGTYVSVASLTAGDQYAFDPAGVLGFRITNISSDLELDPSNPLAFPIGLSFVDSGTARLSINPITTAAVPEPGALAMLSFSLLLGCARRRRV